MSPDPRTSNDAPPGPLRRDATSSRDQEGHGTSPTARHHQKNSRLDGRFPELGGVYSYVYNTGLSRVSGGVR